MNQILFEQYIKKVFQESNDKIINTIKNNALKKLQKKYKNMSNLQKIVDNAYDWLNDNRTGTNISVDDIIGEVTTRINNKKSKLK